MTREVRPTWMREGCPAWCARDHEEDDHPDDRYHQSEASYLPIITSARPTAPITQSLDGVDLLLRLGRYEGEVVDWLVIEAADRPEPRLVLTVESARLLHQALGEQLRRHDA